MNIYLIDEKVGWTVKQKENANCTKEEEVVENHIYTHSKGTRHMEENTAKCYFNESIYYRWKLVCHI